MSASAHCMKRRSLKSALLTTSTRQRASQSSAAVNSPRHAVHAGGALAAVVLGRPPHGEQFGGPGPDKEPLQSTNSTNVATACGLVAALLELEDRPLDL